MAVSETCQEKILSEDYMDFITGEEWLPQLAETSLSGFCVQEADSDLSILYLDRNRAAPIRSGNYFYENIPSLFIPLSTSALNAAGIFQAAEQPVLNLQGQGVIIAFADTGIDYTLPAFRDEFGNTRILRIWDQTVQSGSPPEGLDYGTEFTSDEINKALRSDNPRNIVNTTDYNGHGTFTAGAAAGSRIEKDGQKYQGAAPLSDIVAVKLKPAKQYLKQYYRVPDQTLVFQENDIMLALRYFRDIQKEFNRPLVVCFTLGTNQGGHEGGSLLGLMLQRMARRYHSAVICAAGNEAVRSHHYYGSAYSEEVPDVVELQVGEEEYGFTMEIWPDQSELVTLSLVSPSGQQTERLNTRPGLGRRLTFVLEGTAVTVDFWFNTAGTGSQIITLRFDRPAPGLWRLMIYSVLNYNGGFHIWLPAENLIRPDTVFLRPDVDVTLTDPSAEEHVITVGAYDHVNGSIYLQSGRGNNRIGQQKPTIAAPGVAVEGPSSASISGYEARTGTSGAAAIAAGVAASLFTWGAVNGNLPAMTGTTVKFFMIIGAEQSAAGKYPNKEWGYGTLNLYRIFEELSRL